MATLKSLLNSAVTTTLAGKSELLRAHIESAQQSKREYSSGLQYTAEESPDAKRNMIDQYFTDRLSDEMHSFISDTLNDLSDNFADAIMNYLLDHRTVEYGSNGNLIGYSGTPIQGSISGRVSYTE